MDPLIGKSLAQYTIVRELGSGGVGVVYEAQDSRLGRRVALKVLSEEMGRDATMLERFQREARAASALNHPGICTVYAIEQHERRPFIVMELLEGQTFTEILRHSQLDVAQLIDVAIQIADALESAHSKGIVHRDLKPANLFLNSRGQVKILDFGLAKMEEVHPPLESAPTLPPLRAAESRDDLTVDGSVLGTVSYMSPEQARGQLTDARTDLFSLGTLLYQLATGALPFPGDTHAMIFVAILTREPIPLIRANPGLPADLGRIVEKALEKDRNLRYQSATEIKTDLLRLKRDFESGHRRATELTDSKGGTERSSESSVAVLYFENLSGGKEDEYFRDGVTEDIITELSKIKGLNTFSRPTVLAYRDRQVTPAQIGQQLGATHVLAGSLRRAGNRLRINAQLVDTLTDFPLWSERYDREMKDVFEVQDEIARKIAEALRITLTPQEKEALAARPTENLQAYDLYLRGRSYSRRQTRQDLEFALQMFENAVVLDPGFGLAYAAIANVCSQYYYLADRDASWLDRARSAAEKVVALQPDLPEAKVAQGWIVYAGGAFDETIHIVRDAIRRKRDCEGAYYLLLRALFSSDRYQEIANIAEEAIEASGTDYNVYVPIANALGALGKKEALKNLRQRMMLAFEGHLRQVPEDARARILLSASYAAEGRIDDAIRETNFAMVLRPNDGNVLYNAACTFCALDQKSAAMDALGKAWRAGYRDPVWVRRDPDLAMLHGDPEFERLYPEKGAEKGAGG